MTVPTPGPAARETALVRLVHPIGRDVTATYARRWPEHTPPTPERPAPAPHRTARPQGLE